MDKNIESMDEYIELTLKNKRLHLVVNSNRYPNTGWLYIHDMYYADDRTRVYEENIIDTLVEELKTEYSDKNGIVIPEWRYLRNEEYYQQKGFISSSNEDVYILNW